MREFEWKCSKFHGTFPAPSLAQTHPTYFLFMKFPKRHYAFEQFSFLPPSPTSFVPSKDATLFYYFACSPEEFCEYFFRVCLGILH